MPAKKSPSKKTTKKKQAEKDSEAKKGTEKLKASDLVKRESHTPAIFKAQNGKKSLQISFSMEDVREILKKRSAEEPKKPVKKKAESKAKPKEAVAVSEPEETKAARSKHSAASLDDILGISTGPSNPVVRKEKNVPVKFKRYYDLLLELREQMRDELNLHSNDTLKRSIKDDSGDSATSVDAGTENFDRDFALSMLSNEQEALNEIEAAIQRIHNGTYGVCEVTGQEISEERLEAVPFTRFSLEGQQQHEQTATKRVQKTGAFLNEGSGENITFGDDDADS